MGEGNIAQCQCEVADIELWLNTAFPEKSD